MLADIVAPDNAWYVLVDLLRLPHSRLLSSLGFHAFTLIVSAEEQL